MLPGGNLYKAGLTASYLTDDRTVHFDEKSLKSEPRPARTASHFDG
jgi:hypothetical protein